MALKKAHTRKILPYSWNPFNFWCLKNIHLKRMAVFWKKDSFSLRINVQASPLHVWHLSPKSQFWTVSKLLINCPLPHLHLRVVSQWVWICVYVVRQKRSLSCRASGEKPCWLYCQPQTTSLLHSVSVSWGLWTECRGHVSDLQNPLIFTNDRTVTV